MKLYAKETGYAEWRERGDRWDAECGVAKSGSWSLQVLQRVRGGRWEWKLVHEEGLDDHIEDAGETRTYRQAISRVREAFRVIGPERAAMRAAGWVRGTVSAKELLATPGAVRAAGY